MFFLWGLLALTAPEKRAINHALDKIKEAQASYDRDQAEKAYAWEYAAQADAHSAETDAKIGPLQSQVDVSHKNEQDLANQVQKYKPFYDQAHKLWGIMGIILCFGILAGHILILIGFIVLLILAIWALSLVFPIFGPVFAIIASFFKRLWASVARRK